MLRSKGSGVAQPDPIARTVIQKAAELLGAIVKPEYPFDFGPRRIQLYEPIWDLAEPPLIAIVRRTGKPNYEDINGLALPREVFFSIGALVKQDARVWTDPDEQAEQLIASIQRAMHTPGFQFDIAVTPLGADLPTTVNAPIQFFEAGSVMNANDPLEGKVLVQVDYNAHFDTSVTDPRRL